MSQTCSSIRTCSRGRSSSQAKTAALVAGARTELARIEAMGGAVAAVESGYMKSALVSSHAARRARVESGEDVVVGVNRFVSSEPNPLLADLDTAILVIDPAVESAAGAAVKAWRAGRDDAKVGGGAQAAGRDRRGRRRA